MADPGGGRVRAFPLRAGHGQILRAGPIGWQARAWRASYAAQQAFLGSKARPAARVPVSARLGSERNWVGQVLGFCSPRVPQESQGMR
jgi:hypothetical protein